jgi:hypothetical protein
VKELVRPLKQIEIARSHLTSIKGILNDIDPYDLPGAGKEEAVDNALEDIGLEANRLVHAVSELYIQVNELYKAIASFQGVKL